MGQQLLAYGSQAVHVGYRATPQGQGDWASRKKLQHLGTRVTRHSRSPDPNRRHFLPVTGRLPFPPLSLLDAEVLSPARLLALTCFLPLSQSLIATAPFTRKSREHPWAKVCVLAGLWVPLLPTTNVP